MLALIIIIIMIIVILITILITIRMGATQNTMLISEHADSVVAIIST